jgi:hypothetical protein
MGWAELQDGEMVARAYKERLNMCDIWIGTDSPDPMEPEVGRERPYDIAVRCLEVLCWEKI